MTRPVVVRPPSGKIIRARPAARCWRASRIAPLSCPSIRTGKAPNVRTTVEKTGIRKIASHAMYQIRRWIGTVTQIGSR